MEEFIKGIEEVSISLDERWRNWKLIGDIKIQRTYSHDIVTCYASIVAVDEKGEKWMEKAQEERLGAKLLVNQPSLPCQITVKRN